MRSAGPVGRPERVEDGFTGAALPSLRRLRLAWDEPASVLRFARTYGPQLEELALGGPGERGVSPPPGLVDELQPYVAGDVHADRGPEPRR